MLLSFFFAKFATSAPETIPLLKITNIKEAVNEKAWKVR